jgi:hypothetical protein
MMRWAGFRKVAADRRPLGVGIVRGRVNRRMPAK